MPDPVVMKDVFFLVGSKCLGCKHLADAAEGLCDAFPDGIPPEIMYGQVQHDKPFPGDQGIHFEKA